MGLLLDRIRSILDDGISLEDRLAAIEEAIEIDRIALVARAETAEAMLVSVQRQYDEALEKLKACGGNIYE